MSTNILFSSILPSLSNRAFFPAMEISTVDVNDISNKATYENIFYQNYQTLNGQSSSYGARNVFKIDKVGDFLRNVCIEIPGVVISSGAVLITDYLGHALINRVEIKVDGTETMQIQGDALLMASLEYSESQDKKDEILRLSGYKELGSGGAAITKSLYIPISHLFTNRAKGIGADFDKPFPLYMLKSGIEIAVIYTSANANVASSGTVTLAVPNLIFEVGNLPSNLQKMDKLIQYPFSSWHYKDYKQISFTSENPLALYTINQNFTNARRGEITDIYFRIKNVSSASVNNLGEGYEIKNLQIRIGGALVYDNSNRSDRYWDITNSKQDSVFGKKQIQWIQTAALSTGTNRFAIYDKDDSLGSYTMPVLSTNAAIEFKGYPFGGTLGTNQQLLQNRYYRIPLSEIRNRDRSQNNYVLGVNLEKLDINIQCQVLPLVAATAYIYQLDMFYVYNAVYQMSKEDSALLVY